MADLLKMAEHVNYTDASDYLSSRKWTATESRRGFLGVYRSPAGSAKRQEVHVPLERELQDYAEAMLGVARGIALYEERDPELVLRDLTRLRVDVLRFAQTGRRSASGSVGLVEGVELVSGAKKALLASACSVRQPRRVHPRMTLVEAESFVRACRLGQTEVGSFVLTVEAPLKDAGGQPALVNDNFGRQASACLFEATGVLANAIRRRTTERLLTDGGPVVSANLCDALVQMMPSDEGADLQLSSSWSPIIEPPSEALVPRRVTFDRDMYEEVEKVASQLRRSPSVRDQFFGFVDELAGEMTTEGRQGEVLLRILLEDEEKTIKASAVLGPQEYREAAKAHLAQDVISVYGVLYRGRRMNRIDDPRYFQVHEKDEE